MTPNVDFLKAAKEDITREKKISQEMNSLFGHLATAKSTEEKNMLLLQVNSLKKSLKETNQKLLENLEKISVPKPLNSKTQQVSSQTAEVAIQPYTTIEKPIIQEPVPSKIKGKSARESKSLSNIEKTTLRRIKEKKKKITKKKIKKASKYVQMANKTFSNYSLSLLRRGKFKKLEKQIIIAKLQFIPASYLSIIFFTTMVSIFAGILIFLFFLFFNFGVELPIITLMTESIGARLLKVFWIPFVIPIATFLLLYSYPSMEKSATASRINRELPFATIHMASISSSMIDPSKIFNIIVSTKEYPYLEKEFNRLINEVEIYGYNLVTALKNIAENSPSKKLSELFTGLATTISSGGDLPNFFEKRAESLLFDYKIEREKDSKAAETFMDIYISVVIAAPMILMLLLMMMKISGLGVAFSTSTITLMTILGVVMINIIFLTFLHLKRTSK